MLKKVILGLGFIGAASGQLHAASDIQADRTNSAYVQDASGTIVRAQNGMCWRTGFWTPADAVPGCDGLLLPPIAKPTAPELVPPPIAPATQASAPFEPPTRCDFSLMFNNDELFAFNTTALNTAARRRLDEHMLPLLANCGKIETILITGHTDRIGSASYNQKLSEKRAEMVMQYLRSKGVDANIQSKGAGETQPLSSCSLRTPHRKLIACLAADRRVSINVRGFAR